MLETTVRELLDLLLRWVHLIAGIMWVGNSLLFNWLDRNLEKDESKGPRHVGRIWLLHSGGYYDVEKTFLAPDQMPRTLHWFKWQSYTTWMSGVALLALLYWTSGASLMIDPSVMRLTSGQAVGIGVGTVVLGWLLYDGAWRLFGRFERAATLASIAFVAAVIWGLTHVLSGRAAFIHVGAMLGTCMAGNVFMHIVPSQRELVAATLSGKPQDVAVAASKHAKQRSIHNNYLTFPLLFTMLSNHFSVITGSKWSFVLLGILFVGGAMVRHWLNIRFTFKAWIPALAATITVALGAVAAVVLAGSPAGVSAGGERVAWTTAQGILQQRCNPCHSDHPTIESNPPAPSIVRFGTPDEIAMWKERIAARAVVTRTMPLNNRTEMTDDERDTLGRWLAQGAPTQ